MILTIVPKAGFEAKVYSKENRPMRVKESRNRNVSLSDGDLLIGPCQLQRPMTTTRDENGTRGSRDQGNHQGRRSQDPGLVQYMQRFSTLFPRKAGDKEQSATLFPPPPPLQGSLGRDPLPPSTELPLPQENYHLGLTSVKTSFRPPNLGQKPRFGHKTTE